MADLPSAGAKLELDLSEWESNWSSVMGDASDLQSTLDDLSGSVDVDVNLDIPDTSAIDDLEALDGEQITPEIDTTESEDSKDIRDGIMFLATMKAIEVAINVVGTALDFIKAVGSMVVTPFLDVEDAVARINAQTGGTGIEDLDQFIRDIQAADLGDSVEQISDVVIKAKQLGLPIKEATESALLFTHTWDEDPSAIVGAWGTALQTGIVDTMQEATDLMTVFFQQGGNIGGDAVNVVQDNAQSWADMGLNMAQALSIMDSLQQGTGASATDAAKMMQTFDDALTAAAADPASQQAKLLSMMGVDNPKEQGAAIGAETFNGFAEEFATLSSENQDLISGMFFGKGGKRFTGAIGEMTSEGEPFKDVVDAAALAATEIDNSLRGAIDDFVLEINTKISELLSSDAIDLPGKIRDLKKALQEGVAVLSEGGNIGEALEVALNIPGLAETIDTGLANIERIFGQLVISLLEVVAFIQDPLGTNDKDKGTRAEIARLATQQLPFDLKVANPDEVADVVNQAAARGVTNLGGALNTAMEELIAGGDFSKAKELLGAVISDPTVSPEAASVLSEKFNTMISDAQAEIAAKMTTGEKTQAWWDSFMQPPEKEGGLLGSLQADMDTAIADIQTKTDTATSNVASAWSDLDIQLDPTAQAIVENIGTIPTAAEDADARIATALTGNTVTQSFMDVATAAASSFPGVIAWFEQTTQAAATMDSQISSRIQHLINILKDLQFLSAQVSTGVQQAIALGGQLPSGGNVTNNNVVVHNIVPNSAAAAAGSYTLAASLRPGGV